MSCSYGLRHSSWQLLEITTTGPDELVITKRLLLGSRFPNLLYVLIYIAKQDLRRYTQRDANLPPHELHVVPIGLVKTYDIDVLRAYHKRLVLDTVVAGYQLLTEATDILTITPAHWAGTRGVLGE
jgi:hypothetical protein